MRIENEEPAGAGAEVVAGALRAGDLLAQYAPGDYEALLLDTDPDARADDRGRRGPAGARRRARGSDRGRQPIPPTAVRRRR